jgi:hypothetical protein
MENGQELSEPVTKARRSRRQILWIALALVVVAAAIAAGAATHRGPYTFLDRFHPQQITVDTSTLYPPAAKRPTGFMMTMLVFAPQDADAILASLKGELTKSRGYLAQDLMSSMKAALGKRKLPEGLEHDQQWVFAKSSTEVACFESGHMASYAKQFYAGKGMRHGVMAAAPSEPACVVLIRHDESWLERQISSVRAFLRLG